MAGYFPVSDDASAGWLGDTLEEPWGRRRDANYVAAIIPQGFSGYARILHPVSADQKRQLTWAEVASYSGKMAHAQMQWPAIAGQFADKYGAPALGSLPERQAKLLAEILARHTLTPQECYFALWEGWGYFKGQTASFQLPNRSYYLFRGSVQSAAMSMSSWGWQSANLWWPRDRAWCVATEVDFSWTYVAGSAECIEGILGGKDLESWPASPDDRTDIAGDQVNVG